MPSRRQLSISVVVALVATALIGYILKGSLGRPEATVTLDKDLYAPWDSVNVYITISNPYDNQIRLGATCCRVANRKGISGLFVDGVSAGKSEQEDDSVAFKTVNAGMVQWESRIDPHATSLLLMPLCPSTSLQKGRNRLAYEFRAPYVMRGGMLATLWPTTRYIVSKGELIINVAHH